MADAHERRLRAEAEPGGLVDSTGPEPSFAAGPRPGEASKDIARIPRVLDEKTPAGGGVPSGIGSDWPFV
jgi:hypothetical protein